MAEPLRVMPAARKRRALDPGQLRDPLGTEPAAETPTRTPRQASPPPTRRAKPARRTKPSPPPTNRSVETPSASAELAAGPRVPVAVMFEPQTWTTLVAQVDALRDERDVRSSANALLVAILATELPEQLEDALDLVGRHVLELADCGAEPRREQHTVRLPKPLIQRLDRHARGVRDAGFEGGRSALVNAVLALRSPDGIEQAARALQAPRRARAAAVIRIA